MSQVENSKLSLSSSSFGWFIIHKAVLLIIIFAAYSYFTLIPDGMIKTAITVGILAIAAATAMAGKVIDLGLPITGIICYTIAKLTFDGLDSASPVAYAQEIALTSGVLGAGITGFITGKIITRKYIPAYFGSFAVPTVILYLIYLIFNNTAQSIGDFLTLNNMYSISDKTQYIFAGITGLLVLIFSLSKYGKNLKATGSSSEAAIEAGIDTKNCIVTAYTLSGLLAGAAGILLVHIPQDAIQLFYFPVLSWLPVVFLGAVIGDNKFSGGKFDVSGAFLGGVVAVFLANVIYKFTGSSTQAATIILLATMIILMVPTSSKKLN